MLYFRCFVGWRRKPERAGDCFTAFKKEVYPENQWYRLVAEQQQCVWRLSLPSRQYSAEAFYEWMNTRKNKLQYTSLVELLLGNIRETAMPAYQTIRMSAAILYFASESRI